MAAALTGRVIYPGDPGWDYARKNFNQRFDVQPRAVAYCQDTDAPGAVLTDQEQQSMQEAVGAPLAWPGGQLSRGQAALWLAQVLGL